MWANPELRSQAVSLADHALREAAKGGARDGPAPRGTEGPTVLDHIQASKDEQNRAAFDAREAAARAAIKARNAANDPAPEKATTRFVSTTTERAPSTASGRGTSVEIGSIPEPPAPAPARAGTHRAGSRKRAPASPGFSRRNGVFRAFFGPIRGRRAAQAPRWKPRAGPARGLAPRGADARIRAGHRERGSALPDDRERAAAARARLHGGRGRRRARRAAAGRAAHGRAAGRLAGDDLGDLVGDHREHPEREHRGPDARGARTQCHPGIRQGRGA